MANKIRSIMALYNYINTIYSKDCRVVSTVGLQKEAAPEAPVFVVRFLCVAFARSPRVCLGSLHIPLPTVQRHSAGDSTVMDRCRYQLILHLLKKRLPKFKMPLKM